MQKCETMQLDREQQKRFLLKGGLQRVSSFLKSSQILVTLPHHDRAKAFLRSFNFLRERCSLLSLAHRNEIFSMLSLLKFKLHHT